MRGLAFAVFAGLAVSGVFTTVYNAIYASAQPAALPQPCVYASNAITADRVSAWIAAGVLTGPAVESNAAVMVRLGYEPQACVGDWVHWIYAGNRSGERYWVPSYAADTNKDGRVDLRDYARWQIVVPQWERMK